MRLLAYLNYLVFTLILGGFALAQNTDVVYNLPSWGQSVLTFALALALFTQAIKVRLKNRLDHVPHWIPQLLTLAIGVGISALIRSQDLLVDPLFMAIPDPFGWLAYGTLAGIGAIGGYDLIKALMGPLGGILAGGKTIVVPPPDQGEKVVDTVLTGLLAQAAKLHPAVAIAVPTLTALYNKHGKEVVQDLIDQQRALTPKEIRVDQDRWKAENPVTEEELEQAQKKLRLRREPQVAEASDRDPFTEGNQ